jgi:hypothetical protein
MASPVDTLPTQLLIACLRISSIVKFRIPEFAGHPGHRAVSLHLPAGGRICVEDLNPLSTFRLTPLGGPSALKMFAS